MRMRIGPDTSQHMHTLVAIRVSRRNGSLVNVNASAVYCVYFAGLMTSGLSTDPAGDACVGYVERIGTGLQIVCSQV
jgi:hypothetical protein